LRCGFAGNAGIVPSGAFRLEAPTTVTEPDVECYPVQERPNVRCAAVLSSHAEDLSKISCEPARH
jgi:hypothetical protein